MSEGGTWLVPRTDKAFTVRLGGTVQENWENGKCSITYDNYEDVRAVPYDMMISGSDCKAVNVLRLWKAVDMTNFNMNLFSQGQYVRLFNKQQVLRLFQKFYIHLMSIQRVSFCV